MPGGRRNLERSARFIAVLLCVLVGIGTVIWSLTNWDLPDMSAYLGAAERLLAGDPLYPPLADINTADVYRYAPWFAVLWIPMTMMPVEAAAALWSVVLAIACGAVILPVLRLGSHAAIATAALLGGFLVLIASRGNVQPLMIAALAYGVERRSGPIWIALAASLKATPALLAIVYVVRGEYWRAAVAAALTVVLVAPMFVIGLGTYPSDPGFSHSLWYVSPWLFWTAAACAVALAVVLTRQRPRLAWLGASIAAILALPRFFAYDLTLLFVGAVPAIPQWSARSGDPQVDRQG